MKSRTLKSIFFVLSFVFLVCNTSAQLTFLPVSFSPKEHPGLNTLVIHGDFGLYNYNVCDYKALAGRVVWNPGRFSIMGGAGLLLSTDNQRSNGFITGASFGYDLKPGIHPWKPIIQIQGGIGYTKIRNLKQWNLPIALGAGWVLLPPGINIRVWIMSRLNLRYGDDLNSIKSRRKTSLGPGVSTGISLTSPSGPGVHFGADYLYICSRSEFLIAAGFHWDFVLNKR
ncbi:MAG: hypothetical protein ACETWK_06435 [Candidatus Aminicenantaceae bacterium]